ncbi:Uncharacterised protein [Legionella maceachernii]|nr:hypothetical protein SAMN02745128_01929 [Legionella maceachernii]SUO99913.1 Uncharacterised protein [Legionella maceachernii]
MRYYYCQQLGTYYKIGNEDRKKKIYGFESEYWHGKHPGNS